MVVDMFSFATVADVLPFALVADVLPFALVADGSPFSLSIDPSPSPLPTFHNAACMAANVARRAPERGRAFPREVFRRAAACGDAASP